MRKIFLILASLVLMASMAFGQTVTNKRLKHGYDQRIIKVEQGTVVMIRFPASALKDQEAFDRAVPKALVLSFGCKAIPSCKPVPIRDEQGRVRTRINGELVEVRLLTSHGQLAGIAILLPRPISN